MNNKVILITGGGAGIGRAAAIRFAEAEATVVITGRRTEPLQHLSQTLDNIDHVIADAADPESAPRTVETVIERWGRLDVSGQQCRCRRHPSPAGSDLVGDHTHLRGKRLRPLSARLSCSPYVEASGRNIVNVSSTFGHKAAPVLSHYEASRAALEYRTRSWALELARKGIRVNAVAAGPTETEFLKQRMGLSDEEIEAVKNQERNRIPLGRRGLPEEVAAWIVELASDSAAWMNGQVITVDGGLSVT